MKKLLVILVVVAIFGYIYYSSISRLSSQKNSLTPFPVVKEAVRELTGEEEATMTGSFIKDFQSILEGKGSGGTTPTMIPAFSPSPAAVSSSAPTPSVSPMDTTAPTVAFWQAPAEGSEVTEKTACVTLGGADNATLPMFILFTIQMDKEAWTTWSSVSYFCFTQLPSGLHTIRAKAKDASGNVSPELLRSFTIKE